MKKIGYYESSNSDVASVQEVGVPEAASVPVEESNDPEEPGVYVASVHVDDSNVPEEELKMPANQTIDERAN